jgi:hypothetical protein
MKGKKVFKGPISQNLWSMRYANLGAGEKKVNKKNIN